MCGAVLRWGLYSAIRSDGGRLIYNAPMTLVGVISDTHGRLDRKAYEALADCDHIIHAGDICNPATLRELKTIAPVTAVLGNNDFAEYGESVGRFARPEIDGVRFLVAHYPRDVRISAFGGGALAPGDPIPDVCIHGHTHIPRLECGKEARPAQFLLCPGSASYPRGGNNRTIAKIEIEDHRVKSIRIEALNGRVLKRIGN